MEGIIDMYRHTAAGRRSGRIDLGKQYGRICGFEPAAALAAGMAFSCGLDNTLYLDGHRVLSRPRIGSARTKYCPCHQTVWLAAAV